MFKNLGLKENCVYGDNCRVEILHKPTGKWFPLLETRNKIAYVRSQGKFDEITSKVRADKIEDVNFIDENTSPKPLKSNSKDKQEPVSQEPLAFGLMTNTDYRGSEVEVEHEDKGWLPLLATSNKVLYINEKGEKRRMTLSKLVSVRGVEEPEKEDEEVLTRKNKASSLEFGIKDELFERAGL